MSLEEKLKRLKETTKPEKLKDSEDGEILYGWCVSESTVDDEMIYSKRMSAEKFDELYERDPNLLNDIKFEVGQQHGLRWSEIDGELMFVLTITEEEFKMKQEFLDKGMHPPKDEYLQGFPHGLGVKKRIPFRDFDAWLKSCPIPYYLSSEMSDQEETYTFDLRNLMDKYDEELQKKEIV